MKKREILFLLALILVLFAMYWNTTGYELIYDSKNLFANNPVYRNNIPLSHAFKYGFLEKVGLSLDKGSYYRPLTTLSFLIEKKIWGLDPRSMRVINLFVFALTLIALFIFFKIQGLMFPVPHLFTVLFALHPLQVDNIVWVVGRSDLMFLFFGILCLLFLELYSQKHKRFFIVLSLLCYGLGIFSKESMLFLLPVLLIYEKVKKKRISPQFHLLVLIITGAFLTLKYLVVGVLSVPSLFGQDPLHYLLLILATTGYYLKSILLPYSCPAFLPPGNTITNEHIFLGIAFVLLFVLLVFIGRKRVNLLIPLSLILVFLMGHLVLVFTSLYPFRASSRYLVFPLLGFVWMGGILVDRISSSRRSIIMGGILLLSFIPFVFINQSRYVDEMSFWKRLRDEFPTQGYFSVKTAELLANQKKYFQAETALAELEGSKMDLPAAIDTSLLWARIEFVKARYTESEEWLQKMATFPLYPEAKLRRILRKVMILISTGKIQTAESELKYLIDKFGSRESMVLLYELYLGQESWAEARELENRIKKKFPGVLVRSTAESRSRFEVSSPVDKFRFYIAYKNYSRAINILQTFPEDVDRELLRAKILYWNGQEQQAEEVVHLILNRHSGEFAVLNRVADFYLKEMNRLKPGLFYLKKSLKIRAFQPEVIRLVEFLQSRYKALL